MSAAPSVPTLTFKLAPSPRIGDLPEAVKKMDDDLKTAVLATTNAIAKIPPEQCSWDNLVHEMLLNPLIEPDGKVVARSYELIKGGSNLFKFDGSPDPNVIQEVITWFNNLIGDEDITKATPIDIGSLATIVAQTGATVVSVKTIVYKKEEDRKKAVDIGVLRYPDLDYPHFRLYRIQLEVWSISERRVVTQYDTNGITGEFRCLKYKPRESVLAGLREETKEAAAKQAEDILLG